MKREFVPYEIALELKELGFDKPCFGFYIETGEWTPASYSKEGTVYPSNSDLLPEWVASLTFSQAFRFFREKYNFEYQIIKSANGNYSAIIHLNTQEYLDKISTLSCACIDEIVDCYSYEEAELACIIKLIEIVKNK